MNIINNLEKRVEGLKRIIELQQSDADNLVVVRPLSDNYKKLIEVFDVSKTATQLSKEVGCSRAMVYKIISDLCKWNIIDLKGSNDIK